MELRHNKTKPLSTFTVKHKSCPVTKEIQSVGFSVSYFKLTIVFIIPKIKSGIPKNDKVNTIL